MSCNNSLLKGMLPHGEFEGLLTSLVANYIETRCSEDHASVVAEQTLQFVSTSEWRRVVS